jgi:omega-6 fatty acid desaturase (delta-12 desaturase)
MREWRAIVARYQVPSLRRAIGQIANTLLPLAAVLVLMYISLSWPRCVTLALSLPAAGLLVRTFIIMHDCAHGSFLRQRRANEIIGYLTGLITLTPFGQWRHEHAIHHATSGDLDRRGHGDIATLTVREYLARSRWQRLKYRLYRNPAVMLGLGPLYLVFGQRLPKLSRATGSAQNRSVWLTNAGVAIVATAVVLWIGWKAVVWIYVPAVYLSAVAGIWLFYVQHQFDDAYWERHESWDYPVAAVTGSTCLKLPGVLQWFTGNIGLHHVHHLGSRIPNYHLQRCHDENPLFQIAPTLTLWQSLRLARLALWDEAQRRLVSFSEIRDTRAASRRGASA